MSSSSRNGSSLQLSNPADEENFVSYHAKYPTNQSLDNPVREYNVYEQAYDHFNECLFHGQLPKCLITLQRIRSAKGYYAPERFVTRHSDATTDEIALNPDTFMERTDKEILSTLVHEACHLYQEHFGKPASRGYHNRAWARLMLSVGLRPISIDEPGKMTGRAVTHEILPGGRFDRAADELLATGFCLHWQSALRENNGTQDSSTIIQPLVSKCKYKCIQCGANAWAKPSSNFLCGACLQKQIERCEHWMYADEILAIAQRCVMRLCLA